MERKDEQGLTGRSLAIGAGSLHTTLGLGDLGRGNHLHGLGDLLNVGNRLQTKLDYTQQQS